MQNLNLFKHGRLACLVNRPGRVRNMPLCENNNFFGIHLVSDFSLQNKPIPTSCMRSWTLDFPCVPELRTSSLQFGHELIVFYLQHLFFD